MVLSGVSSNHHHCSGSTFKKMLVTLLIALLLANTTTAVDVKPDDGSTCFSLTRDIVLKEIGLIVAEADVSEMRKYTLCSNTVYKIGEIDQATFSVDADKQFPSKSLDLIHSTVLILPNNFHSTVLILPNNPSEIVPGAEA
jgi:hypothetical protein